MLKSCITAGIAFRYSLTHMHKAEGNVESDLD